jgi:hypothetical protein
VLLGKQRRELVEARLEVAVVVQAVDHHLGERAVAVADAGHAQLLAQVLLQAGLRVGGSAAPVVLLRLAVVGRDARGLLRDDELLGARRNFGGRFGDGSFGVFLEERVGGERLLHFLGKLQRGHLEQP